MRAAELLSLQTASAVPQRKYWDKANFSSFEEQQAACAVSTTVYVGNLSYYTSEQHVYELARQAGPIRKVIMGLHREKKTPCGFAFVEYFTRNSCLDSESLLTGKTLEGRVLKIEVDPGFKEGRQFGRGRGGGQVRDDFREEDDPERGGVGSLASAGLLPHQQPQQQQAPPFQSASNQFAQPMTSDTSGGYGNSATGYQAGRSRDDDDYRGGPRRGKYNRDSRWGDDQDRYRRQSGEGRGRARSRDRYGGGYGRRSHQGAPSGSSAQQASMVDEFGRDIVPQRRAGEDEQR